MPAIPPDHRVDPSSGAEVFHNLAEVMRRQPDGVLVLGASVGIVVAAAALLLDPLWTPLALPALAAAAFGGWGILDRTVGERRARRAGAPGLDAALGTLGTLLVLGGWLALGTFLLLALGRAFGGWIH